MAYVSRYGPDGGGGFYTMMEADTLNAGHYASGGDVMGLRQSLNGGNSWYGCNKGMTGGFDYCRAIAISKRSTTSGLVLWGTGGLHISNNGGGYLGYSEMGDNAVNVIDSTNGFGNTWFGPTGAGQGPANFVRRACGELIRTWMAAPGGTGNEYIYTVTPTGFHRYLNGGSNAASIGSHAQLKTLAELTGTTNIFVTMLVLDTNHIVVVTHNIRSGISAAIDNTVAKSEVIMLTNPSGTTLSTATAAQVTATKLTLPSGVSTVYSLKDGKDGHFYAACAYDGVYEIALNGNDLTWTPIPLATGSPTADKVVSSVDAASDRTLWIGQGGSTNGSYDHSSGGGMTPGHAIVKGVLSAGKWTYSFPASGAALKAPVFQSGDGTTATGANWFLFGNGPDLGQDTYDSAIIRVDPFNNAKVGSVGRAGIWQTRNTGTDFYPAMDGLNGGEYATVRVSTTNGGVGHASNQDYGDIATTDGYVTCTRGGGATPTGAGWSGQAPTTPYTGTSGAKYVYTAPTATNPAKLTKQVGGGAIVEISDELFRGAVVKADQIAEFADGTVIMGLFGGLYILDPTAPAIKPDINLISPASASVGDTVTLTGLRFTGAIDVKVNGQSVSSYTVVGPTSITFTVPSGASTGIIRVTTPDGSGVSATSLTVNAGPGTLPTVTALNPTHGPVGTSITVTGTNLSSPLGADVNGTAASFTGVNSTTVTIICPTGATTGPVHIRTANGTNTVAQTFTVDAGPPPSGQWNDGKLHRACTLDYFPGNLGSSANATALAGLVDAIVGWARIDQATNDYGSFGPALLAANPDLIALGYMKSDALNGKDPTTMPEGYYAHTCAGARITNAFGLPSMQPDGSGSFTDARGFSSTSYGQWKAKDCWAAVDNFNTTYPGVIQGVMLDSMYTASYVGSPCKSGTVYSKPDWVNLLRTQIADKTTAQRSTGTVWANGLQGPASFYATNNSTTISSDGLCDHVGGAIAESWLRQNYAAFGTWPALTGTGSWMNSVQMLIDADTVHNCVIWCIVNIANDTSGNAPAGWVDYTTAELDQWKRFSYCTFMLGQRGRALYEFVSKVTVNPWDETHGYWTQSLGAPTTSTATVAAMKDASGLYIRAFANGQVYVNPTAAGISIVTDRKYKEPVTGTSYPLGSTIIVNPHDGLLLMVDGSTPVDTDAPVVLISSPTSGQVYQATTPVTVKATATDSDGIASVSAALDGGSSNTMVATANANEYAFNFGPLSPGAHTIAVQATDAFSPTPLQTTASVSFTVLDLPVPNTAPVVSVTDPGSIVVLPATALVTATVTDTDGISSVTVALDGGAAQAMTASGSTYSRDLGALAAGSHTIVVKATDANASPLSTSVTRTFLVTTDGSGGGSGGGGGSGTPLVISTDVGDIELRIKERGLG